jgi:hypothetical protein
MAAMFHFNFNNPTVLDNISNTVGLKTEALFERQHLNCGLIPEYTIHPIM